MAETGQDAEVYGGDDPALDFVLTDRNGDPLDTTDWSFLWGMAPLTAADATLRKSTDAGSITIIETDDPVSVIARVKLTKADTANLGICEYRQELKGTDADGNTETLAVGVLTIRASILD